MKIETGLFSHMVLQRNRNNKCDACFSGECSRSGEVTARVVFGGRVFSGFSAKPVGRAVKGRFEGLLQGLPAGGPYDVELAIVPSAGEKAESVHVKDVLVGDVWILGGQSNMEGGGRLPLRDRQVQRVRAFYMNDEWGVASDPIHQLWTAVDPVHRQLAGGVIKPPVRVINGAGPGVYFGREMERLTGVPQGLIACAHGGTSMGQWAPEQKHLGGSSLYGAMLRRVMKNGGKVAGVVWYQGCSEANIDAAPLFMDRMESFIASVRSDLDSPALPFAMVQIARYSQETPAKWWNLVQESQRLMPQRVSMCTVVPAVDLDLEDPIHISGSEQPKLGIRLAGAMYTLCDGKNAAKPPIEVADVRCVRDPISNRMDVIVAFRNVEGRLESKGRPCGFSLTAGTLANHVFKIELSGNEVILKTGLDQIGRREVSYGAGTTPYCNVTDSAGRPLPVFGPLLVGCSAVTPFVRKALVSRIMPGAGNLSKLACPVDMKALGFRVRKFDGDLLNLHQELEKASPSDKVVFYACKIESLITGDCFALMGYDGPVKVWMDRKECFHDANGRNPAGLDKAIIPIRITKGTHNLLIALGSNKGQAWGVRLRFGVKNEQVPLEII